MATPARPGVRKDCGIKILEITEQPIGYAQAKKRKKAGKFFCLLAFYWTHLIIYV